MNSERRPHYESLPPSYFVSREGALRRIVAGDRDDLRSLRTELSLLKQIRRISQQVVADRGANGRQRSCRNYSVSDRSELVQILTDAADPTLDSMINVLDREYDDARKGILMSVVHDEAKKIVEEAVESGALPVTSDSDEAAASAGVPDDVNEAIAAAEAGLAAIASPTTTPPGETNKPEQTDSNEAAAEAESTAPDPPTTPAEAEDKSEADKSETAKPEATEASIADSLQASDQPAESTNPAEKCESPATKPAAEVKDDAETTSNPTQPAAQDKLEGTASDSTDTTQAIKEETPAKPDPVAQSDATTEPRETTDCSNEFTAQRAEQAVIEIEKGIRKLADVLSNQVSGQWSQAKESLDDVVTTQAKIADACKQVETMLADIEQSKQSALTASQETHKACEEAREFREHARRAKERADTSAAAAELAADQATKEASTVQKAQA